MQNYLIFLDLTPADEIKKFFDEKFGESNYVVFDEVSTNGKQHCHMCLDTHYKRDTLQKWIISTFPQLKRQAGQHGGEHKYGIKLYPQQYKSNACYDEYPQDYITKDNAYRCGKLWDNDQLINFHSKSIDRPLEDLLEEKIQRYTRLNQYLSEKKTKHKKAAKTPLDVKFQKYISGLLSKDPYYFYKKFRLEDGCGKTLNQKLLIREIKKFYIDNGKPGNRNIFKVIAEAVIWYGEIVCPEDIDAAKDSTLAIENEIDSLLCKKY